MTSSSANIPQNPFHTFQITAFTIPNTFKIETLYLNCSPCDGLMARPVNTDTCIMSPHKIINYEKAKMYCSISQSPAQGPINVL